VVLLHFVVSALLPIATGCAPQPQPEAATRPRHRGVVDSLREAEAVGPAAICVYHA
jgi:hypothetical protein